MTEKTLKQKKAFEKIKRNNICKEISDGGLGAISVVDQQIAFQIKWFKRGCMAIVKDSAHGKIVSRLCKSMVSLIYLTRASVKSKEVEEVAAIQSDFWRSVVKGWLDFDKRSIMEDPESENDTRKQPLFNNTQVRYQSKPLFNKKWIKAGLIFMSHIVSGNTWRSIQEIRDEIGDHAGFQFDYWAVTNAVKREWDDTVIKPTNVTIEGEGNIESNISDMAVTIFKLNNKEIRNVIIKSKNSIGFWKRKFGIDIERYLGNAIRACKETRLRLLHFKILHNIYPTNILLRKMKIKNTDMCEFCNTHDFIEHFFFHCKRLENFGKEIEQYIMVMTGTKIKINERNALFGILATEHHILRDRTINDINMILLVAKMCISKVKYGKARSLATVFEVEMAFGEKLINHSEKKKND